jgi:Zn-finger nucleic acid-binding protein
MKCPTCKDQNLVISERAKIEIDYCPECRGIWLDRGELDKILERSREEESEPRRSSPPQQQPNQYDNNQYQQRSDYGHKPYKRKKSFLEELFD